MSLTIILLYLVAVILSSHLLVYKIKRWKYETLGEKIPGPRAYPLVGNSLKFAGVRNPVDLMDVGMVLLKHFSETYGRIFRVWIGPLLAVCVTDLDDINALLSSPHVSTKHWWYTRLLHVLSFGLFGRNGKEYLEMKKSFTRYFHIKEIESYMSLFEAKAVQLLSKAEKKVGTGVFSAHDFIKNAPLDLICATHLGAYDMNETDEDKHEFFTHLGRSLKIAFTRALRPEYLFEPLYKLTKLGRENVKSDYQVSSISRSVVSRRLEVLKSRGIDINSDFEEEFYTDAIIKKGTRENWPLQDMALGVSDVVVAGSDTTSIGISYLLLCLAMHPEYQERAYQEQMEIFGDSDRLPTFKEAMGMPFLTMCYKESLRLYGPAGIARELTADFQLREHLLPKGSAIFLLFYPVHRNPAYYCRPNEFYPDHFSAEACSKRPKQSFIAFSQGTRGCPGTLYSFISTKIMVSLLIRNFRFSSPLKYKDMKFSYSLMIENEDGYPIEIHRRTNRETA